MSNDLVSVIIPTYNRSNNLCRAIDSALYQTYINIEVIVVDDNPPSSKSRAMTEFLMNRYTSNSKVIYLKHPENKNGAAARNTGIAASNGYYIAFLDDDDVWDVNKIKKQVDYLTTYKNFSGCYCLSYKFVGGVKYYSTIYKSEGQLTYDLLSLKTEIYTPSLLFYKSVIVDIGGFDESFERHQDFELLVKFFRVYNIGCVSEYLLNVNVDDCQNHPSFPIFKEIKLNFLVKFKGEILQLSNVEQAEIYKAHYFELFFYAVKKNFYLESVFYFIKGFPSFSYLWSNKKRIISITKKRFLN